jgi:phosphopantetheine--protein transferase-like protein
MENKIKDIVSVFIKVPAEQISHNTIIDRSSVNSSITLHRMYAKLAEEGIVVQDYWNIQKFAMLLERVNGSEHKTITMPATQEVQANGQYYHFNNEMATSALGIDIEEVDAMPKANDFREDAFYQMNFSSTEIAHCILQPNPYASFAGLFAAKEAIVKANNSNRNKSFNSIVINHDQNGKPGYPGFDLSVSHTNNLAIAVALQAGVDASMNKTVMQMAPQQSNLSGGVKLLMVISVLISLTALVVALLK